MLRSLSDIRLIQRLMYINLLSTDIFNFAREANITDPLCIMQFRPRETKTVCTHMGFNRYKLVETRDLPHTSP